jgi:predicted metal-binding transcription factor (methanogenesis marker protein 9)
MSDITLHDTLLWVARSVKKRNRHLAAACAPRAVAPVRAVELLSQQYFFTSPKLAALATEAEILQKVCAGSLLWCWQRFT